MDVKYAEVGSQKFKPQHFEDAKILAQAIRDVLNEYNDKFYIKFAYLILVTIYQYLFNQYFKIS